MKTLIVLAVLAAASAGVVSVQQTAAVRDPWNEASHIREPNGTLRYIGPGKP